VMVWKYHQPGHTIDEDLCCCLPSDECRPYLPCCLRDLVASFGARIVSQDTEFPDDPDAGSPALVRVSRFTLKNLCNSQESVDWSTWQDIFDAGGGEVRTDFGGASFQGCTFGIDVSLEDLFCGCGDPGEPNFRFTVTLCNPNDFAVWVVIRNPDLCFSFEGIAISACCLDHIGLQEIGPVLIDATGELQFSVEFKLADWKRCLNVCYRGGPPAILEDVSFLNDGYDHTCLRPITCIGEVNPNPFMGSAIPNCDHSLCPRCGCVEDDDCELAECCSCGCDGVEAMNSCAPPKELCSGCSADGGKITVCESIDQGFGVGQPLVRCVNSLCQVTATIGRNNLTGTWSFTRAGDPGAQVTAAGLPNIHCTDYDIEWEISGGEAKLTIDGTPFTNPLPPMYSPTNPSGQCWVVASGGGRFTLK